MYRLLGMKIGRRKEISKSCISHRDPACLIIEKNRLELQADRILRTFRPTGY